MRIELGPCVRRGDRLLVGPSKYTGCFHTVVAASEGSLPFADLDKYEYVPEDGKWWELPLRPYPRLGGRIAKAAKCTAFSEELLLVVPYWEHPDYGDDTRRYPLKKGEP